MPTSKRTNVHSNANHSFDIPHLEFSAKGFRFETTKAKTGNVSYLLFIQLYNQRGNSLIGDI